MAGPQGYGFSERDAGRISRVVQHVERTPRLRPQVRRPAYGGGRERLLCQLTGTLESTGTSVTAKLVKSISTTGGGVVTSTSEFTVYDTYYGNFEGESGARGEFEFWGPDKRILMNLICPSA